MALMDGRLITEMRTAAVSAVAFEALAPLHFATAPTSFGILGSGVQAHAHIEALRHVWPDDRGHSHFESQPGKRGEAGRGDGRSRCFG